MNAMLVHDYNPLSFKIRGKFGCEHAESNALPCSVKTGERKFMDRMFATCPFRTCVQDPGLSAPSCWRCYPSIGAHHPGIGALTPTLSENYSNVIDDPVDDNVISTRSTIQTRSRRRNRDFAAVLIDLGIVVGIDRQGIMMGLR